MLDFLFYISAKKVVVACAILGALLVTLGPLCLKYGKFVDASAELNKKFELMEKLLGRAGYGFVGLSITLFIIAGFIVDLR